MRILKFFVICGALLLVAGFVVLLLQVAWHPTVSNTTNTTSTSLPLQGHVTSIIPSAQGGWVVLVDKKPPSPLQELLFFDQNGGLERRWQLSTPEKEEIKP